MQWEDDLGGEGLFCLGFAELAVHGGDQLLAGLQTDAVAFHPGLVPGNAVGNGDVEPAVFRFPENGHRFFRVSVFADVGKQVVKNPADMVQIQPQCARRHAAQGADVKAFLAQGHLLLEQDLLDQHGGIKLLDFLGDVIVAEYQEKAEQLVGQTFQTLGVVFADLEIAQPLGQGDILVIHQLQIAHKGGQRSPHVMGYGGDQLGVGLQRRFLMLELFNDAQAHGVHILGQLSQFVVAVREDLPVQISLADLPDLTAQGHNGVGHPPVIEQHYNKEHQASDQH